MNKLQKFRAFKKTNPTFQMWRKTISILLILAASIVTGIIIANQF